MSAAPDVIVFSPHLDDAVLSLGGMIGREAAKGRHIEVWTCFTSGPEPDHIPSEFRALGDYFARRNEDQNALSVLKAVPRWLDFRERLWRTPPLRRSHHVFHTPSNLEGFTSLRDLRAVARQVISMSSELFIPLGVGRHHDHVEVVLAFLLEALTLNSWERMRFYEDPYAQGDFCRRAHYVTKRNLWKWRDSPVWASPRIGLLLAGAAVASKGPRIEAYAPELKRLQWSSTVLPITPEDESRKIEAVLCYTSQVKLFGGDRPLRAFLHRYHEVVHGEPIWQARPQ